MLIWPSEVICFCRFPEFFIDRMKMYIFTFVEEKVISMQIYNLYFIYCSGKTVVTFPDTKYRDREKKKKAFQGFLAHSDRSLIRLWQEHFSPSIMNLLWWILFCDRPFGSLWYVDLYPPSDVPFCPLILFIYHSSNPVSFLIKYHFLKSETDEIIYCKLCTFVILVLSLSNHL